MTLFQYAPESVVQKLSAQAVGKPVSKFTAGIAGLDASPRLVLPATSIPMIHGMRNVQSDVAVYQASEATVLRTPFVPAEQTFCFSDGARRKGTLYAWPGLFIANAPGVPLGIARDALDVARAIWVDKVIVPDMKPARDEPRVRTAVARAEAMVGSVRSYTYDTLDSFWATLEAGDTPQSRRRVCGHEFADPVPQRVRWLATSLAHC